MISIPETINIDPKSMTYRDVNKKLKELKESFLWDLKPGSILIQVTPDVPVPCNETINGVTYNSKLIVEKVPVVFHGFSHDGKKLTFEELFKIYGLKNKKLMKRNYWMFHLKKNQYVNKVHQYLNTAFAMNVGGERCFRNVYVWLTQIEKDKVYFNFSASSSRPFHSAYLELNKEE